MDNRLEQAQDRFFSGIGRISDAFGLNRLVAQLYVLLYFNGEPMSLDEIVKALGVSKGSVSVNIRELEKWGVVNNVWIKGSRKDYYQAEADLKKAMFNKIRFTIEKRSREVDSMVEEFEKAIDAMGNPDDKQDAKVLMNYRRKLKEIKKLKSFVLSFAGMFGKII